MAIFIVALDAVRLEAKNRADAASSAPIPRSGRTPPTRSVAMPDTRATSACCVVAALVSSGAARCSPNMMTGVAMTTANPNGMSMTNNATALTRVAVIAAAVRATTSRIHEVFSASEVETDSSSPDTRSVRTPRGWSTRPATSTRIMCASRSIATTMMRAPKRNA
ncbi:hypothetical protein BJI47_14450 [Rhodococcus sp. 1168]|nr:hypothetical protein BJI47_14450 [Rhodococcus sp. 1168]